MKSGYNILWTDHALQELQDTIEYLKNNFSDKEIRKLALKIEETTELISKNPKIFAKSEFRHTYRVVILKFNTMYLRGDDVEILSFFSNRQSPNSRKIKK